MIHRSCGRFQELPRSRRDSFRSKLIPKLIGDRKLHTSMTYLECLRDALLKLIKKYMCRTCRDVEFLSGVTIHPIVFDTLFSSLRCFRRPFIRRPPSHHIVSRASPASFRIVCDRLLQCDPLSQVGRKAPRHRHATLENPSGPSECVEPISVSHAPPRPGSYAPRWALSRRHKQQKRDTAPKAPRAPRKALQHAPPTGGGRMSSDWAAGLSNRFMPKLQAPGRGHAGRNRARRRASRRVAPGSWRVRATPGRCPRRRRASPPWRRAAAASAPAATTASTCAPARARAARLKLNESNRSWPLCLLGLVFCALRRLSAFDVSHSR